jgi:hypothetical protein
MKNLITFIIICFISISAFAQKASITVFSQDGQKFYVVLNGIRQNSEPATNVKVTDLTLSSYKSKIIFEDAALPAIDKMIYTQDVDGKYYDAVYNIRKDKKGNLDFRINSYGEVAPSATSPSNTVAFKTVETPVPATPATTTSTTQTTTQQTNIGLPGNVNFSTNTTIQEDEDGVKVNMNLGGFGTTTTTTTTTTTNTVKSTNSTIGQPVTPSTSNNTMTKPAAAQPAVAQQGCVTAASASDFAAGKNSIKSQSFSDTQLKIAKTFTKNNCLSVAQIKEVMSLFSFEETKLDYAKYAYDFCVDKKNYFQLTDAFSFSSSADDLYEFLEGK